MLKDKFASTEERFREFLKRFYENKWYEMYATDIVAGNFPEVKCNNSDLLKTIFKWSDSREPMNKFLSFCKEIGITIPIEIRGEYLGKRDEYWINVKEINTNRDWTIFLGSQLSADEEDVEYFFQERDFEDEYVYKNINVQIYLTGCGCSVYVNLKDSCLISLKLSGGMSADTSLFSMYEQIRKQMESLLEIIDFKVNVRGFIKLFMQFYNITNLTVRTEYEEVIFNHNKLVKYVNDHENITISTAYNYASCVVEGTKIVFEGNSIKICDGNSTKQIQQLVDFAQNRINDKKREFSFD